MGAPFDSTIHSFMSTAGIAMAAVLGLLLGSFYTALASRILYYFYGPGRKSPRRMRDLLMRGSACAHCATPLRSWDLVPVVSYLSLRGRCRHCAQPIGWPVLLGEVFPGFLLPLMLLAGFGWPTALFSVLACGHLYTAIATDFNFFLLDHENTALVFLFSGAAALTRSGFILERLLPTALGAGVTLAIFLLLFVAGRGRGMGFADVPLATSAALLVGFPGVLVLFTTASAGALVYVLAIRRDRHSPAPFGVFLAGAACLVLVGSSLWRVWQGPYWFPNT